MVENSPKWSRWLKVVQSQSFAAQFIRKRRWIQYLGLDFNALATKDRLQALDEESHAYRFFLKSCHNNISLHKKKIQNRNVRSSRFLRKYTFSLYFFVAAGALKALKALISTPGALKSLTLDHPSCQSPKMAKMTIKVKKIEKTNTESIIKVRFFGTRPGGGYLWRLSYW